VTSLQSVADHQRYFNLLLESQFWPEAKMLAYQRRELEPLLRHARASAPFYRDRLAPLFRADGSLDWDRWSEVPILKRPELVANRDAIVIAPLPGHGTTGTISTSGSTGFPLQVVYTFMSALTTQAVKWRADTWYGIDWSKVLYFRRGDDTTAAWPQGVAMGPWGPPWDAAAQQGKSFRVSSDASPDQQLELLRRIGATYAATGGPKQALAMAFAAERHNLPTRLDAILTSGEGVDAVDRDYCRRLFGSEIFDVYSSKEGNHMASRCPTQGCWHVNAETLLLEIVDDDGRACAPGETGRVVITPFYATAQPLIRYDHGDLAVAGDRCACGRTLPALTQLLGRVVHLFRHPDGRTIARFLPEKARALLKAGPWQIAQTGPNAYELRYIPLDWSEQGDEAAVETIFRQVYFPDARLSFCRTRSIPPLASGKFMEYVNEFSNPPPPAAMTKKDS